MVTDHRALLSLKNISDNNAKLYRWSIKLSGLDYSISYIKGELNIVADYLSRDAVVQAINLIHHDVLLDSNHHDNQLEYSRKVIKKYGSLVLKEDKSLDYLIYHGKNSRESWLLKPDNTVWQRLYEQKDRQGSFIDRWYVPDDRRREILSSVHDTSHFGFKKCYGTITANYYWPNMSKHLKVYCSTCELCMRKKYPRQHRSGKLGRLASTKPGGLIAVWFTLLSFWEQIFVSYH